MCITLKHPCICDKPTYILLSIFCKYNFPDLIFPKKAQKSSN